MLYRNTRLAPIVAWLLTLPILYSAAGTAQAIGTTRLASGLSMPTYVASPPEDFNRIFVTELATGNILIRNLTTGTFNGTPFLTVPGVTNEGLQGLAFHPNYDVNGFFYVYYFTSGPQTVVVRYTRDATNPDLADPTSALTIIKIFQPVSNHNGGWIGFGPDGFLYVPLGDGGGRCDPSNNGQNTDTLLSSVLRLDVNRDDFPADSDRNYGIPSGNPFVGQAGADEIWSYGVRNPFRASFDRATGDFYIGDVGEDTREEVNFQSASNQGGDNYGWDLREGSVATPDSNFCDSGAPPPPGHVEPIYDYEHGTGTNEGNSVTGGYVYRGPETEIQGKYFFGDFENERIWSVDAVTGANFTDRTSSFVPDVGSINQIVSFGEDSFGNLYIVDLGGEIFRVDGPVGFVPCPDLLLSDDAVMGTEIFEHCRNIAVGPSFTIGDGGDLTLRAGNKVVLRNGTTVEDSGELTLEIDPALQQTPP